MIWAANLTKSRSDTERGLSVATGERERERERKSA